MTVKFLKWRWLLWHRLQLETGEAKTGVAGTGEGEELKAAMRE